MASIPQSDYVEIQYGDRPVDPLASAIRVMERRLDQHIGQGGSQHAAATEQMAGFMSAVDKQKMEGIQAGATRNSPDEFLLNRGNHTGLQAIETVEGLRQQLDDALAGGSNFRGLFPSLAALQQEIPVAAPGNYADVDEGQDINAVRYIWDESDQEWVSAGEGETLTAPQVKALYESNPNTNAFNDAYKDLLESLPGADGGARIGVSRPPLASAITNVNEGFSTLAVSPREYAQLVVDRPNPNDDKTWDWSPAIQQALIDHNLVEISGDMQVATPLYRPRNLQKIRGGGPSGGRLLARGDIAIFEDQTNFIEGWVFENLKLGAVTPGQGIGFYSPSSRYLATVLFRDVSFEATLRVCVQANLVIAAYDNCDFGTFGAKTGASHQHIISIGQTLDNPSALTTGLVNFNNCRFRNARGQPYASRFANGYDISFTGADIEMNAATVATFRFEGIYGVHFGIGCWAERNGGISLVSLGMDTIGNLQACQGVIFENGWYKAEPENQSLLVSDTTNFSFSISGCTGAAWSGKALHRVGASINPIANIRQCTNNTLVGLDFANRERIVAPLLQEPESTNYISRAVNPQYTLQHSTGATQGLIIGAGASASAGELILQAAASVRMRASAALETLRVDPTQVSPGGDNSQSGGSASRRYTQLFAATATVSTSDEREKKNISIIDESVMRAWGKVEYMQYKFRDAVAEKGDSARWHFGLIAQRVKEAFEAEGLDPFAYGILCYDKWSAEPEVLDDDGNVLSVAVAAGERYGIRYEEALALECCYLRAMVKNNSTPDTQS